MKKIWLTSAFCLFLIAVVAGYVQTAGQNTSKADIQAKPLVGNWYMGTMSGFDCNLEIRPDNTLTVQFGGCFHQDPPIKTRWKIEGDKIRFRSTALDQSLGSYLRVARYKNHFVLLPERQQAQQGQHPYSYNHCFWRNLMKNGLQLSKDAPT